MDARQTPAYRLELALLKTLSEIAGREQLPDPTVELAVANLFCTIVCTLGVGNGHSREMILRHIHDLGPLLVQNVRTKLDLGPPPDPAWN